MTETTGDAPAGNGDAEGATGGRRPFVQVYNGLTRCWAKVDTNNGRIVALGDPDEQFPDVPTFEEYRAGEQAAGTEDALPRLLRVPSHFNSVADVLGVARQLDLPNILVLSERADGSLVFLDDGMSLSQANWLLDRMKTLLLMPEAFERKERAE